MKMQGSIPLSYIIRHRKENLKKCSLKGLENRPDLIFLTYPLEKPLPPMEQPVLLSFEGVPLSSKDAFCNLILVDGTWKLSSLMEKQLAPSLSHIPRRTLPSTTQTAYPRKQTGCSAPDRGLASVEALYMAYKILNRPIEGMLDHYYWAAPFLESLERNPPIP